MAGLEVWTSFDEATSGAAIRTRTQARITYVYCIAHHLNWSTDARARVDALQEFVDANCRQNDGAGYVRTLSTSLAGRDTTRDLYDHACFLLADAWKHRAFGDEAALHNAHDIVDMLDARLGHRNGGWQEGDYDYEHRRQNPHMHLFEAFLALADATGDDYWLLRARQVYALFTKHFFAADSGVLLEFFDETWQPAPGDAGHFAEPGHMMEWVWLLRWYEYLSGEATGTYADTLFANALGTGQSKNGLLFDQIRSDHTVTTKTKRLWPMTELIKAGVVQAAAGDANGESVAAKAIDALMTHFVENTITVPYCDQLDENDAIVGSSAAASSMYHLCAAAYELQKYLTSAN